MISKIQRNLIGQSGAPVAPPATGFNRATNSITR